MGLFFVRRTLVVGSVLLLSGCAAVPGLPAARKADFASLRKTLDKEKLTPSQVRRIARESLSAEIVRAKDREDRAFVQGVDACSAPLEAALRKRSETEDGVGAEAALLLLEGGKWGNTGRYRDHEDGAWRALAARASKNDHEERRSYFNDPDERVRRGALAAAIEAAHEDDVPALLEVSRVDPDPLCRSRAFFALGRIGGPRVSESLLDRFKTASEEVRLAIIDAWSKPALYDAGGREELRRLLVEKQGFDALNAARILTNDGEVELRERALTSLVRFSKDGSAEERRMAIRFLPAHERITIERLVELTREEDQEVAVIAWARLLGNARYEKSATEALSAWAKEDTPVAFQARAALAAAGDESIKPLMMQQMRSPIAENRKVAGNALLRLGALSEMAPLLADEDADVRRDLACRTLARAYLTESERR